MSVSQETQDDAKDTFTSDDFFASTPPPNLNQVESSLSTFIEFHKENASRKFVVITSGGTTVPLEKNTVRFIDNFSTGSRGSASAERFLEAGYAVIFLSRVGSMSPFARHIQRYVSPLLDLKFMDKVSQSEGSSFAVQIDPANEETMRNVIQRYEAVKTANLLLHVSYQTVSEYLFFLRSCCVVCSPLSSRAMIYLAAAVSDFFIPDSQLNVHKIQSRSGPLTLTLPQTPKMLGIARQKWCPNAMMVSFKLETDERILLKKARGAIEKYDMQAVVANQLHTRYEKVVVVFSAENVVIEKGDEEIEKPLIALLKVRHELLMHAGGGL